MATIITKFSSTPSSVPSNTDLVQGELAVNTADKRLYTEDNGNVIIELGTNPSSITTPSIILDGRDLATDRTKLDGIEPNATADQTDAEIKTAYENNADTNAFTDSEKTKLGTVESGADVTDAANVDAAGAVMNTDTSTAAMGFVIDEDDMASNSDTKVPTQQSVEARIQNRITAIGALMVTGTPVLNDYARFTSATEIEGRSYAEVRVDLGLEIGTDVQAELSGLAVTNVTASTSDKVLIQDVSDSNNLKTVLVSDILGNVITDPTLGTLTKTFTANEQATITLSSAPTGQPVVSVSKEVPQTGTTNDYWDVNSSEENYEILDYAPSTSLDFLAYSPLGATTEAPTVSLPITSASYGVTFGDSGNSVYVAKYVSGQNYFYQYVLNTPYDITGGTSTFASTTSLGGVPTTVGRLVFDPTGTKLFTLNWSARDVSMFTLSTAWDITSLNTTRAAVFVASSQLNGGGGIAFNDDGTKMFLSDSGTNDGIYEYDLTVGFDLTTASYNGVFKLLPELISFEDFRFARDGKLFYGFDTDSGDPKIRLYTLTTPWDITTLQDTGISLEVSVGNASGNESIDIKEDDGTVLIVLNRSDNDIYQYDLPLGGLVELGSGSFSTADLNRKIDANSGEFVLLDTPSGLVRQTVAPTSYNQVTAGNWSLKALDFDTEEDVLKLTGFTGDNFDITKTVLQPEIFYTPTLQTNPRSIAFNPDGTKMFILGEGTDTVVEYTLSTAWDIYTATAGNSFSTINQDDKMYGMAFSNDGKKMLLVGQITDTVYGYDLSTGFDISTVVYANEFLDLTSAGELVPQGVTMNDDGTAVYVVGQTLEDALEFRLSSPYNLNTAVLAATNTTLLTGTNPEEIRFSPDGTKMFILDGADLIKRYDLTNPFNVLSATFTQEFDLTATAIGGGLISFWIDSEGLRVIYLKLAGEVRSSTIGTSNAPSYSAAVTKNSTSTAYWTDINSMTADQSDRGIVSYAVSTDDRTTWSVADGANGVRPIVRNNLGTWQYNSNTTYSSVTWVNGTNNSELYTLEEAMTAASVEEFTAYAVPKNIIESQGLLNLDASPYDFAFSSDGTKLIVAGLTDGVIDYYTLSTAYDLSTVTGISGKDVNAQETQPATVSFNNDGTKMFITGQASDDVHEYSLSQPYFPPSATFTTTFDLGLSITIPRSLRFNNDGTKMFIIANNSDRVYEFPLSTGFDISTASASTNDFSVANEDNQPIGIDFNSDGTKMFLLGSQNKRVHTYTLSTGFDLSTATADGRSYIFTKDGNVPLSAVSGFRFSNDGSRMFITNTGDDIIRSYSNVSLKYINQMDKNQLEGVTDLNHFTLNNDLDLAIIMSGGSYGLNPSSNGVSINYDANTLQKGAINGTDYEWDYPASDKVRITALAGANLKIRVV